jgi:hypothetical protein
MEGLWDVVKSVGKAVLDRPVRGAQQLERLTDPDKAVVLPVRRSLQVDDYSCGVQCTWMVLDRYGRAPSVERLGLELGTTEDGTSEPAIVRVLRRHGRTVKTVTATRPR